MDNSKLDELLEICRKHDVESIKIDSLEVQFFRRVENITEITDNKPSMSDNDFLLFGTGVN